MGVVFVIIVVGVLLAVYFFGGFENEVMAWLDERSSIRKKQAVISKLLERDQQIQTDYQQAKREMNRAAGQEWRNPFD